MTLKINNIDIFSELSIEELNSINGGNNSNTIIIDDDNKAASGLLPLDTIGNVSNNNDTTRLDLFPNSSSLLYESSSTSSAIG